MYVSGVHLLVKFGFVEYCVHVVIAVLEEVVAAAVVVVLSDVVVVRQVVAGIVVLRGAVVVERGFVVVLVECNSGMVVGFGGQAVVGVASKLALVQKNF